MTLSAPPMLASMCIATDMGLESGLSLLIVVPSMSTRTAGKPPNEIIMIRHSVSMSVKPISDVLDDALTRVTGGAKTRERGAEVRQTGGVEEEYSGTFFNPSGCHSLQ